MFTGIITHLGKLSRKEQVGQDLRLCIRAEFNDIELGESIAVNGVCLTVTKWQQHEFSVDVSQETIRCSALKKLTTHDVVNLERSVRASDRLGGHWVSGHVDGLSRILEIRMQGQSRFIRLSIPQGLAGFIAAKGSITLEGISLTVNAVTMSEFTVNIIPHTWEKTSLQNKHVGDELNLEIDVLARYVQRLLTVNEGVGA
ncbi:MAG TPA: riboflavin synthase [Gammaproteobacteria bacterium]|nr:riboflavin synthase [Gammaproteobacteria bacterium]